MKPEERQRQVAAMIGQEGQLSVEALAGHFGVSAETIRRDLAQLSESGMVQKVHGGARAPRPQGEGSFEERMAEDAAAKRIIAAKVAAMIAPGETLFVDTGSTTLACAETLRATPKLTVITNSVRIARSFGGGDAQVLLLGGTFACDAAQTLGPETIRQIAEFRADRAILATAALDPEAGVMDSDLEEAHVARAMLARARSTIVVAAASKFGRQAPHRICDFDAVDVLVTETAPPREMARVLDVAGVTMR